MDFEALIKARRSVRGFTDQVVESEKLHAILLATSLAPSAGNLQAYEVYHVTLPKARAALARAANQSFIAQAPFCLVFFTNPGRSARKYGARGHELYALQDATIAATYAMLAVADLGLATVWVGAFDDDKVASAIGAPADWRPVAILPIGYGSETPEPVERRPLGEMVHEIA
jgi:nitroreductase